MISKQPIVRSKVPLRVSFCGGGTDFPHFYNEFGGVCLTSTINKYVYCTIYPRDDNTIKLISLDFGLESYLNLDDENPFDGVLDLCKATVVELNNYTQNNIDRGMDIVISSDAPPGSGLGGSSALVTAIILAVSRHHGIDLTPPEVADLNYTIERIRMRIPGGKQDQYATAYGGFNLIEFYANRTTVTPLKLPQHIKNDLEAHCLLYYTGRTRKNLNIIDHQINMYKTSGLDSISVLGTHELKVLTYQMKEDLLNGNLNLFAEKLNSAFESKLKMNPTILDDTNIGEIYSLAKSKGAIGGKLCGAGGGGYVLFYVPTKEKQNLKQSISETYGEHWYNLSFDDTGPQVWRSSCN